MVLSTEQVIAQLRVAIGQALAPSALEIIDDSPLHVGHPGAGGGGHYRVRLVSEAFRGRSPLERHRMVYAAVAALLKGSVHALNISARTADEKD
ncbi:MAG: BolA family protein [Steroidobacteraceae bacterium]